MWRGLPIQVSHSSTRFGIKHLGDDHRGTSASFIKIPCSVLKLTLPEMFLSLKPHFCIAACHMQSLCLTCSVSFHYGIAQVCIGANVPVSGKNSQESGVREYCFGHRDRIGGKSEHRCIVILVRHSYTNLSIEYSQKLVKASDSFTIKGRKFIGYISSLNH